MDNKKDSVLLLQQHIALANKEAWYYVRIDADKMPAFIRALRMQDSSKKLTDFGEVLHSGYDHPSEELAKKMAEEYQLVSAATLMDEERQG